MEQAVNEKFFSDEHKAIWSVVNNPLDVVPIILNTPLWDKGLNEAKV
jgi:hypothetical protein